MYITAIYVDVKILRIKHKMNHPRVVMAIYHNTPLQRPPTVAVRGFNVFVEHNMRAL